MFLMKFSRAYKISNIIRKCHFEMLKPPWKVLFFGTDQFSLYSLQTLFKEFQSGNLLSKLEVVTTLSQRPNPVQKYAESQKLNIHNWPSRSVNSFDIGLVVSFGHLIPETVIEQFPLGMLNVHASLLPRWRGAAPIIYALAYGDTETGVSIMQIKPKRFDVGDILLQQKTEISSTMTMPDLHEKLGQMGANCLLESLQNIPEILFRARPQSTEGVTYAPKVTPSFTVIHWTHLTSMQIYNLERATKTLLTPTCNWHGIKCKLSNIKDCGEISKEMSNLTVPGSVFFDRKSRTLKILCANRTFISVRNVGVAGKRLMSATDFYNGFISKETIERRIFT